MKTDPSSYEKNWDAYAQLIDQRKDAEEWAVLREARESHWRSFFTVDGSRKVLDAGCGHGDYSVFAAQNGARVWSFDFSYGMSACAKSRMERIPSGESRICQASVAQIPFPDSHFDDVFCLAVLDHVPSRERRAAFREFFRVLKPGGHLYLDVPNRLALHWRSAFLAMKILRLYPGGKIHFFFPWELKRLARLAGFVPQRTMGLTVCPPFSGIYTTDIRRMSPLPRQVIRVLDRIYLMLEKGLRKIPFIKPFCWHFFLLARKS